MVQFRPKPREIIAKIVYYGPPLGGKTTNLRTLYKGYPADTRGELVVVPAGGDRTIFFDFLPLDAGRLRGMKLRVQLYTVPGQVHYNATRQIVLRGVDAVVFVADSQRELMRSNRDSWENLKNNLLLQGLTLSDLPHVLQYNKRDCSDILDSARWTSPQRVQRAVLRGRRHGRHRRRGDAAERRQARGPLAARPFPGAGRHAARPARAGRGAAADRASARHRGRSGDQAAPPTCPNPGSRGQGVRVRATSRTTGGRAGASPRASAVRVPVRRGLHGRGERGLRSANRPSCLRPRRRPPGDR